MVDLSGVREGWWYIKSKASVEWNAYGWAARVGGGIEFKDVPELQNAIKEIKRLHGDAPKDTEIGYSKMWTSDLEELEQKGIKDWDPK